ncbi:MAG: DUF4349 domain-containing protein, partial [Gemmataceae bacterium]|nr:DUF4349 domain-containing protein [Gemmataceae bacterium]
MTEPSDHPDPSEHAWVQANLAAYLAGGLSPAEAERLDAHTCTCGECADALAEIRTLDGELLSLFAAEHPHPDLEDRAISALQATLPAPAVSSARQPFRLPFPSRRTAKAIAAVAALLVLGTLGAFVGSLVERGGLPLPGSPFRPKANTEVAQAGAPGDDGTRAAKESEDEAFRARIDRELASKSSKYSSYRADYTAPNAEEVTALLEGRPGETATRSRKDGRVPADYYERDKPKDEPKDDWAERTPGRPGMGMGMGMPRGPVVPGPGYDPVAVPPGGGGVPVTLPPVPTQPQPVTPVTAPVPTFEPDAHRPAGGEKKPSDDGRSQKGTSDNKENPGKPDPTKKPDGLPKPEGPSGDPKDGQPDPKTPKTPDANPEPTRRIIIRSGDMEFEIDSFDAATATITKLVLGIKGAFVATVNSDKLSNGKVRGTITVRIPPEQLDGLVMDLRKELGKTGELKGVKLASQDITKMYTDLESRLRAARTMEQRLLQIIKEGKGEIKQLLEAERELGVWRTKVEELEGELRYYSNLAAFSTLNIVLTERELRKAATFTERERVQAGVEVEDVDKAYQQLLAAVVEAKGRVIKSELKQLSAGQFNATFQFEVPPESGGPIRDRLKMLGRTARLEIDRGLADEAKPASDAKPKQGDTVFYVQIYNLANVTPRETVAQRIAANDVPAAYQALR